MGFFDAPELKPNELYRGYEQPSWKLMPNQPEDGSFQIRCYPAACWTSTAEKDSDNRPFWRLFNYIQGKNDKEQKMAMTVPVTMKMSQKDSNFTMSFFTPSIHQQAPPAPSNPDVFIEDRNEIIVYVRNFSGFAKKPRYKQEADRLYKDLIEHGIDKSTISPDSFYAVGYDSPFRLFNRRNEVWIVSSKPSEV